MVTKKILLSLLTLLLLAACSTLSNSNTKNYDFVIFDDQKAITFRDDQEKLVKIEERKLFSGDGQLQNVDFFEDKGTVYGTSVHSYPIEFKHYRLNKETLKMEKIVKPKGKDAFTASFHHNFFYATAVFNDRIEIYKYDTDFNLVLQKDFRIEEWGQLVTYDMISQNDRLYLSIGGDRFENLDDVINEPSLYHGIPFSEIWELTDDLELVQQFDLQLGDPNLQHNYMNMIMVDDTIYLSDGYTWTYANKQVEAAKPGKNILSSNLKTGKKQFIPLTKPAPTDLSFDKERKILQVLHSQIEVDPYTWTLIDLVTGNQRVLEFDRHDYETDWTPFSTFHNGNYYYLFNTKLVKYNYDTQEQTVYDLSKYGITSAEVIMFKNDDSNG